MYATVREGGILLPLKFPGLRGELVPRTFKAHTHARVNDRSMLAIVVVAAAIIAATMTTISSTIAVVVAAVKTMASTTATTLAIGAAAPVTDLQNMHLTVTSC